MGLGHNGSRMQNQKSGDSLNFLIQSPRHQLSVSSIFCDRFSAALELGFSVKESDQKWSIQARPTLKTPGPPRRESARVAVRMRWIMGASSSLHMFVPSDWVAAAQPQVRLSCGRSLRTQDCHLRTIDFMAFLHRVATEDPIIV